MRFNRSLALRVFVSFGILGWASLTTSCDSTARIFVRVVQFDRIQIVSVTPVRAEQTSTGETVWVPACGGDAERVRINFNLKSTQRNPRDGETPDRDTQIRPNEAVGKTTVRPGSTISAESFGLNLTCIAAHTGDDSAGSCAGTPNPTTLVETLEFVDNLPGNGRKTPIGVAIVIDQSGSTSGNVEGTTPPGWFHPTCLEGKPASFDSPQNLGDCASDDKNLRLAAVKDFLGLLNDEDKAIVFAYNEVIGVSIVCNLPGVDDPDENFKAQNCYTNDRRLVTGGGGLISALDGPGGLQGQGKGRSNLWTGVKTAFAYMEPLQEAARHIVVIADGPDTCNASADEYQFCYDYTAAGLGPQPQEQCGGVDDFAKARQAILDYQGKLGATPNNMHVSFIHYQSKGYAEQDPRMQEIACLTGGHYVFINANKIAENSGGRREAFLEAASALRLTLGGYWSLVTDISAYTTDATAAAMARGGTFAIEGSLTLKPGGIQDIERTYTFGWSDENHDQRLPIIKACRTDAECGAGAGSLECGTRCSGESQLCSTPPAGSGCGGGICCAGACAAGETLCTADKDPTNPMACP